MKCIYCLEEKPNNNFRKTEHVLAQAFGRFKNNLTLNKIVCDDCNKYFGDHLEISLGRDTFEGISRFKHKVKKPKEFKSLGKRSRLSIKVDEGPFKGAYAYLEYSAFEDRVNIKPVRQVGFKKNDFTEYEYFLLDNIPDKEYLEKQFDLKAPKSIVALGCAPETAQKYLSNKGITFKLGGEFPPPEKNINWECEVTGKIDQIIYRAIAKIAFNYLAYWTESNFLFDSQFDPIRRYIRFGEKGAYPFVVILEKAILGDEPIEGKRRLGHLIVLDWSKNKLSIVSKVSLFNWMTYSVLLAKDYGGERIDIRKGSFFNIADKKIYELIPGDRLNIIPVGNKIIG